MSILLWFFLQIQRQQVLDTFTRVPALIEVLLNFSCIDDNNLSTQSSINSSIT